MSREAADEFVAALWELEENEDVEPLVEVHTEDCEVGNASVPDAFRGHEGLREFWTSCRGTFGEMRSEFRKRVRHRGGGAAGVDYARYIERRLGLLRRRAHPRAACVQWQE